MRSRCQQEPAYFPRSADIRSYFSGNKKPLSTIPTSSLRHRDGAELYEKISIEEKYTASVELNKDPTNNSNELIVHENDVHEEVTIKEEVLSASQNDTSLDDGSLGRDSHDLSAGFDRRVENLVATNPTAVQDYICKDLCNESTENLQENGLNICISDVRSEIIDNLLSYSPLTDKEASFYHEQQRISNGVPKKEFSSCLSLTDDDVGTDCTNDLSSQYAGSKTCHLCRKFFGSMRAYNIHFMRYHGHNEDMNTKGQEQKSDNLESHVPVSLVNIVENQTMYNAGRDYDNDDSAPDLKQHINVQMPVQDPDILYSQPYVSDLNIVESQTVYKARVDDVNGSSVLDKKQHMNAQVPGSVLQNNVIQINPPNYLPILLYQNMGNAEGIGSGHAVQPTTAILQDVPVCIIINDRHQMTNHPSSELSIVNAMTYRQPEIGGGTDSPELEQLDKLDKQLDRLGQAGQNIPAMLPHNVHNATEPRTVVSFLDARESPLNSFFEEPDDSGIFMTDDSTLHLSTGPTSNILNHNVPISEPEDSLLSNDYEDDVNLSLKSNLSPIFKKLKIDKEILENEHGLKDLNLSNLFKVKRALTENKNDSDTKLRQSKELSCCLCTFKATAVEEFDEHIKTNHSEVKDKVCTNKCTFVYKPCLI